MESVWTEMNPVYAWTPYFQKIHFNISFRFTLGLSNSLIFSGFWTKFLSVLPYSPLHATYFIHLHRFDVLLDVVYKDMSKSFMMESVMK